MKKILQMIKLYNAPKINFRFVKYLTKVKL